MRFTTVFFGVLLAATVYGQSIVTPVFVHKDGEASASGYAGSEKDILVDGGAQQVVGWVTFQTVGVDVSEVASATLTLHVKTRDNPGALDVYPLTAAVSAPENSLPLGSLSMGTTAVASVPLGTADVEKVVQLDITSAVTGGTFYGVALVSDDGLLASFDAKEGNLAPVILLTHDIESAAAKWHSGAVVPAPALGKDGDYYLETVSGDVYGKSGGAWTVVTNIIGPQGDKGDTGDTGPQGDTGDKGDTGSQGSEGDKGDTGDTGPAGSFPSGTTAGDMQYWDGTKWVMIPAGEPGEVLTQSGSSVPQWAQIPGTVTDVDGNVYRTIVIGNQEWTVENWRCTKYNDGTDIPLVTADGGAWGQLSTPAYCWYHNRRSRYGALYNWYVVEPSNGNRLAPEGWRVPTDADWTALENYLIANGYNADGSTNGNVVAKSLAATTDWRTRTETNAIGNNFHLNNASGFSALPGGCRYHNGVFLYQFRDGYWWSATEPAATNAWYRSLRSHGSTLDRDSLNKRYGLSVRLVRDLN